MKYWIISDTHFGHSNIIKYCNRPFADSAEMDAELIRRWNSVVSKHDTVLHLGDYGLGKKEYIASITQKLNGHKILIKGNHDQWSDQVYRDMGFDYVSKFPILWNDFCLLSHAPLQLSETTPYFNFYGHIHNDERYVETATSKCVCVERIDYTPLFLLEKN